MRNYTSMYSIVSEKFYRRKNPPIKFSSKHRSRDENAILRSHL
nr:MAG TPA: hypothetical protein [Caudoviricetes sp.]